MNPDASAIDALLPQTQCTQCGFDGCFPYAEAIASGRAAINRCAPGGDDGIHRLAVLTRLPYAALDPAHGAHGSRVLAVIDESRCIGCTICIQKCPVDAIVGAAKLMHTVIADECIGCELCAAPCPVDCIVLVPMAASHPAIARRIDAADRARSRHIARITRLAKVASRNDARRSRGTAPAIVAAVAGSGTLAGSAAAADLAAVVGSAAVLDPGIAPASHVPHSALLPLPNGAGFAHIAGNVEARGLPDRVDAAARKREAIAAALARARARRTDAPN